MCHCKLYMRSKMQREKFLNKIKNYIKCLETILIMTINEKTVKQSEVDQLLVGQILLYTDKLWHITLWRPLCKFMSLKESL